MNLLGKYMLLFSFFHVSAIVTPPFLSTLAYEYFFIQYLLQTIRIKLEFICWFPNSFVYFREERIVSLLDDIVIKLSGLVSPLPLPWRIPDACWEYSGSFQLSILFLSSSVWHLCDQFLHQNFVAFCESGISVINSCSKYLLHFVMGGCILLCTVPSLQFILLVVGYNTNFTAFPLYPPVNTLCFSDATWRQV